MKIYVLMYSIYKFKIKIKFKIIFINKIIILIKKKKLIKYFKVKDSSLLLNQIKKKFSNSGTIILKHFCIKKNFLHCFKHYFKKHHNSYIEKKINDIF